MTEKSNEQHRRRAHPMLLLWGVGLVAVLLLSLMPVSSTLTRTALAGEVLLLLGGSFWLGRMKRSVRVAGALVGVLVLFLAFVPPRHPDDRAWRPVFVESALAYRDVRYVWGGENGRGIDCSGLVRRGFADALLRRAPRDPALVRRAFDLWWNDASARELARGYGGRTREIGRAESLNRVDVPLLPGDFAITADGVHALAYLGDGRWIEADPEARRVVVVQAPSTDIPWFSVPVVLMRWTLFEV